MRIDKCLEGVERRCDQVWRREISNESDCGDQPSHHHNHADGSDAGGEPGCWFLPICWTF
jgi:hypothetical protein